MEDLVLSVPDSTGTEQEEEIEFEVSTPADLIQCAYFAISTVEGVDTGLMSKKEAARIKSIIAKSIDLVEDAINTLHAEIFEQEEE